MVIVAIVLTAAAICGWGYLLIGEGCSSTTVVKTPFIEIAVTQEFFRHGCGREQSSDALLMWIRKCWNIGERRQPHGLSVRYESCNMNFSKERDRGGGGARKRTDRGFSKEGVKSTYTEHYGRRTSPHYRRAWPC